MLYCGHLSLKHSNSVMSRVECPFKYSGICLVTIRLYALNNCSRVTAACWAPGFSCTQWDCVGSCVARYWGLAVSYSQFYQLHSPEHGAWTRFGDNSATSLSHVNCYDMLLAWCHLAFESNNTWTRLTRRNTTTWSPFIDSSQEVSLTFSTYITH